MALNCQFLMLGELNYDADECPNKAKIRRSCSCVDIIYVKNYHLVLNSCFVNKLNINHGFSEKV